MTNIFIKFQEKVGVDKILHFLCGFIIAALGLPWGYMATIVFAFISTLIGAVKELYDEKTYNGGNTGDWLITALGAITAIGWSFIANAIGYLEIFAI